jgi:glycosyltransferase involved in cell wall biosynthesis
MRIAIEALGITSYGGGRSATLNFLEALFNLDKKNEYLIFLSQPEPSLGVSSSNVSQRIISLKNRFLTRMWAQLILPISVRGFDLTHFVKNLGVFRIPTPTVVTVYDMTTLIHPELFPWFDVWYWRHIEKHTIRKADRIIAISNTTANDIVRCYRIPKNQIQVIYPGYAEQFQPARSDEIRKIRAAYGLPDEYIIHVGRIDRKKNLTLLVEAFWDFKDLFHYNGKLVLVGEEYQKSRDNSLYPTIRRLGLEDLVIFTGHVPDKDLPALYSGATLAVFPSVHEGFGLAPIEAMACGTPLIAHSAGAVKEVVGDAAIVLERIDRDSLAKALLEVIGNPKLIENLKDRGLERARYYQRDRTAKETLALYEEIIAK